MRVRRTTGPPPGAISSYFRPSMKGLAKTAADATAKAAAGNTAASMEAAKAKAESKASGAKAKADGLTS